ncbi:Cyanovirin-N [Aspergillus heterothallicus]
MSFVQSSSNIRLENGHILCATTRDRNGNPRESRVDLDKFIGNQDGWFMWDGVNFSHSARNIRLEGTRLTADLPMRNGGYRERQGIELNDRVGNENGTLVFQ